MAQRRKQKKPTTQRLSRRKKILFRIATPILVLLAIAVGLEVVLRIFGVPPRTATALNAYLEYDATCGWVGRPDVSGEISTAALECTVSHDSGGFRVIEELPTGAAPVDEVWVLGDSMVWGWGVNDGETVTDVLNEAAQGQLLFRNLGVIGYSALQEFLLLERLLDERPTSPRMVILQLCSDDPEDTVADDSEPLARPYARYENGVTVAKPPDHDEPMANTVQAWLCVNSLAVNHIYFFFNQTLRRLWHESEVHALTYDVPTYSDRQWQVTGDVHGWIRDRCKQDGIDFAIVLVPPILARHGPNTTTASQAAERVFVERALQTAASRGISVFDTRPDFATYYADPSAELLGIHGDEHLTARGNLVLGEAIWKQVSTRLRKRN